MSDESFERELTGLLRSLGGREAPPSLRDRVATLIAQTPAVPRPWFATAPMRLSFAGLAAVAVVAVAFIVSQSWQVVGPPASASPAEPTLQPSASVTPTPSPTTQPSPTPTATAVPTPVLTPTPSSQPTLPPGTTWTGLRWSEPASGPATGPGTSLRVDDIVPWGNGYVGVGWLTSGLGPDGEMPDNATTASTFLTSLDGLHWTISELQPAFSGDAQCSIERETPHHLVVSPDGSLLAVSDSCAPGNQAPKLWRSSDGLTWSALESPSWQAIWSPSVGVANTLFDLAAGPDGIVAIGGRGSSCCGILSSPEVGLALVAFSSDGATWQRLNLSSAFDSAWLREVTTFSGGFAIVGRVGEAYGAVASEDGSTLTNFKGVGTPAAWVSADGETWRRAEVEGSRAAGATLNRVVAGADGLFAVGWQKSTSTWFASGATSGWASVDGRSWSLVGNLGTALQSIDALAGDGSHMVLVGHQSGDDTALRGWTSSDGVHWTRLAFTGSTSLPRLATDNPVQVVPGGLVVGGFRPDVEAEQFWFATATGP